jgi:hypothetical protein
LWLSSLEERKAAFPGPFPKPTPRLEPGDRAFGIAAGYAVDRLRDLVRRSILARLCLAAEPDPLWPFIGRTSIDASLSDDEQRAAWRARWHERLADVRAEAAAGPPPSAVDFLSPEDR